MQIGFSNFKKFNFLVFVVILFNSKFLEGTLDKSSGEHPRKRKIQLGLDDDLLVKKNKNACTQLKNNEMSMDSSELFFICICVNKINFSKTLSFLLEVMISKRVPKIFCRRLSGLKNISDIEKYFFWEKIPAVLQNAFSNVEKPGISFIKNENDDFLCDLMEFYYSNEESSSQKDSSKDPVDNSMEESNDENKNKKKFDKQKMKWFGKCINENSFFRDNNTHENRWEGSESIDMVKKTLSDDCFFCMSDNINSDIDYKAIGNQIKKKISNVVVPKKPIKCFTASLKEFKKENEKTFEFITKIIFDDDGFFKNAQNSKNYYKMTHNEFVRYIQKLISEKFQKLVDVDGSNDSFEKRNLIKIIKTVELIKYTEWTSFLENYINLIQSDTNRYIFLQLNENNYGIVRENLSLMQKSLGIIKNRIICYKLEIEKSKYHNFFMLTHLNDDWNTFMQKYIIDSKQKIFKMTNNFLKLTNINEVNIEKIENSNLHSGNHSENEKHKTNIDDENYEGNFCKNITISLLSDEETLESSKFLYFGLECSYFSDLIVFSKISINKNFIDKKIYDSLFENKTFYPFNVISEIDPENSLIKVNLNFKKVFDLKESIIELEYIKSIDFPLTDPYLPFRDFIIKLSKYVNSEKSRFNNLFVLENDSMVTQVSQFSMNHSDIQLYPTEKCEERKPEEMGYYCFLNPIEHYLERGMNVLLYRNGENEEEEICFLKITIPRCFLIDEPIQVVFDLFGKSCKKTFERLTFPIKGTIYEEYRNKIYSSLYHDRKEYLKADLIDYECAKKISDILRGYQSLELKIKELADILFDVILIDPKIKRVYISRNLAIFEFQKIFEFFKDFRSDMLKIFKDDVQNWLIDKRINDFMTIQTIFLTNYSISDKEKYDIIDDLSENF